MSAKGRPLRFDQGSANRRYRRTAAARRQAETLLERPVFGIERPLSNARRIRGSRGRDIAAPARRLSTQVGITWQSSATASSCLPCCRRGERGSSRRAIPRPRARSARAVCVFLIDGIDCGRRELRRRSGMDILMAPLPAVASAPSRLEYDVHAAHGVVGAGAAVFAGAVIPRAEERSLMSALFCVLVSCRRRINQVSKRCLSLLFEVSVPGAVERPW
jgi:hypothetical protein